MPASAPEDPILSVRDLYLLRPGSGIEPDYELSVPHFDIPRSAKVGIIGDSGSGKTTFLEILGLLTWPDRVAAYDYAPDREQGRIGLADALEQKRVNLLSTLRARTIGFILQDGGLLPYLTIRENADLGRSLSGRDRNGSRIEALARVLGLDGYLDRYQSALSGGQRQRAAILRTLATDVPLLLADEPTAALDPRNAHAVIAALAHTATETGTTVVAVSHNAEILAEYGFALMRVAVDEGDDRRRATLVAA